MIARSVNGMKFFVFRNYKIFVGLITFLICLSSSLNAENLFGRVSVIDGDTLEMHGERIRLHGIDAPENGQSCEDSKGIMFRCGQISANKLAGYIASQTVRCELIDTDRYGRLVAVCFVGNIDISSMLVREGWALAYRRYSSDYIDVEKSARQANLGLWQGKFVEPWKWRRGARIAKQKMNKSDGCLIKGNISNSGKIYHTPSSPWYDRTNINVSKGERWFCSEEEARSAGWRPPK